MLSLEERRQWIPLCKNSKIPLFRDYYNRKKHRTRKQIKDALAGLVLTPDIVVIDCDKTGPSILPWLRDMNFPYVEESVSGNGYHAIGLGYPWILSKFQHFGDIEVPEYNGPGHIELFSGCDNNKFFVITGKVIESKENNPLIVSRFVVEHIDSKKRKSTRVNKSLASTSSYGVNFRDKKRIPGLLSRIDCSTLSYSQWSAVTSVCKRYNCINEWDNWCQTDLERYDSKENLYQWNIRDLNFSVGYLVNLAQLNRNL